jgi:Protein of unknown function (DUF3887)
MDETHTAVQLDREVMAMMLATNVQLVAEVLRADGHPSGQVVRAIAATRSLETIVDDTLRALVEQARATGHTWAEIGEVLHVTRQAAFQRFGGGGRRSRDDEDAVVLPLEGAVEDAMPVLQAFLDSRWDDARASFDERMLQAISVELLADVRDRVRREAGDVEAIGTPAVSVRDGYTIVDIPVALERAEGSARVVLNADRQVAGFLIRPREALT